MYSEVFQPFVIVRHLYIGMLLLFKWILNYLFSLDYIFLMLKAPLELHVRALHVSIFLKYVLYSHIFIFTDSLLYLFKYEIVFLMLVEQCMYIMFGICVL